jgi:microcystin-dependent protein
LGLNYIIAIEGIYPSQDGGGGIENTFIGEVKLFAGNFAPTGFAFAQGQLLPINQNTALFSVLGTNYGGNGKTNFALPDLRDRTAVGIGGTVNLGQQIS